MKTIAVAGLVLALLSGVYAGYTAVHAIKASVAAHAVRVAA